MGGGHPGLGFYTNRYIFRKDMRQKQFSHFCPIDFRIALSVTPDVTSLRLNVVRFSISDLMVGTGQIDRRMDRQLDRV